MSNTGWQLNGNMADRYEEFLVPVVFIPWAENLLARANLQPGSHLLDLACGTGIVARMAARSGVSAVGSDINPGMLAVARDRSRGLDLAFEAADAQSLPFADNAFDAVICQQGLQFFPDKPAAIAECFRVLRPSGRAIFCTARGLDENPLMHAQVTAFERHLGQDATAAIRAVCGFSAPDVMRGVFTEAGFAPVEIRTVILDLAAEDALGFVAGLMKATPVADRIASMSESARSNLRDTILDAFGDHLVGSSLRFPHSANVVTAARPA